MKTTGECSKAGELVSKTDCGEFDSPRLCFKVEVAPTG
jgi:hypothetical protein